MHYAYVDYQPLNTEISQHIDPEDAKALDVFLPANAEERRTLADIIFEKLQNVEEGDDAASVVSGRKPRGSVPSQRSTFTLTATPESKGLDPTAGLDPKVVAVYTKLVP